MKGFIAVLLFSVMVTSCRTGNITVIEWHRSEESNIEGFIYTPPAPSTHEMGCTVVRIQQLNPSRTMEPSGLSVRDVVIFVSSKGGKTYQFKHAQFTAPNLTRTSKMIEVGDEIRLLLNKEGNLLRVRN